MIGAIWDQLLVLIGQEFGSRVVETWFKAILLQEWNSVTQEIFLEAPNAFVKDWVCNHYLEMLQFQLGRLLHLNSPKIIFSIKGVSFLKTEIAHLSGNIVVDDKSRLARVIKQQPKYQTHINESYVFDTFVVGPNNSLAYAAAHAITKKPGLVYNPLFIYGDSGLGKTHLLHAIGNAIKEQHKNSVVLYQTADRFVTEFISAIRFDKIHKFQARYQMVDVLLIDDIQFISNKDQTQEAFFHIFNALHDARKQIVFSSDTFPQNITGVAERLRSRFGWGLVTDMYGPSVETKIAILKKKAEASNEIVDDDVIYFIASREVSNIRELEGSLIRVIAFSTLTKQRLTVELAQKILTQGSSVVPEKKKLEFHHIVEVVRNYYPYQESDFFSKNRNKELAHARHIAMYLMKKLTTKSLRDIGSYLGNRDHATVKHGIEKIVSSIESDAILSKNIKQIERDLTL